MTASRPLLGLAALVGAGVLALAVALNGSEGKTPSASAPPPSAATETVAPSPPATSPTTPAASATTAQAGSGPGSSGAVSVEDVLAADAPTETLIAGLESEDPIVVGEAVNALVARGAVSALPVLVSHDVIGKPKAAPSLIYAMGKLAGKAEPAQRSETVERLVALMREEKRRNAQESQGNLLQIYEALGDTGDPAAIAPLEGELLDTTVKTAPKVVVVQALVALKATRSRAALEKLASELAPLAGGTDFEAQLRRELLGAIQQALAELT